MAQSIIYTQAMIQQWRCEKITLQEELAKLQNQLASCENEIEQLTKHINKIHQNDIQPRQIEIQKITARIRTIELPKFIYDCNEKQAAFKQQNVLQKQLITVLLEKIQTINSTIASLHSRIEFTMLLSETKPTLISKIQEIEHEIELLNQKMACIAHDVNHQQTQVQVAENSVIQLTNQKRKYTEFKVFYQSQTNIFDGEFDNSLALQKKTLAASQADLIQAQNRAKDYANSYRLLTVELRQLQENLALMERQIADHPAKALPSTTLAELKSQLLLAEQERLLKQQQQSQIQSAIQSGDDDILVQQLKILANQSILDEALALANDYSHESNLEKLFEAKNAVFCALGHFQVAISDKQNIIKEHQKTIEEINSRVAELNNRQKILGNNPFLSCYESNPHFLFNNFTQLVLQTLNAFEEANPNQQSEAERLAIWEIHCKLHLFTLENSVDVSTWQQRLQQVYGLIIYLCNSLNASMLLFTYFNRALKSIPLDDVEALNAYHRLQQESPAFIPKNRADLAAKELQDYATACAQFTQTLNQLPVQSHAGLANLKASGFTLLKTIQHQKEKLHHEFNLKFTTTLLTTANQLASPTTDTSVRQRFIQLTSKVETGKPSLTKKIVGAALVFLGAAILAISISAKILSLGVATPVTVLGMCIGVKTILGGVGLFSYGMQRGMLSALTQYYDSQDHNLGSHSSATANFFDSPQKPETSLLPTHTKAVC